MESNTQSATESRKLVAAKLDAIVKTMPSISHYLENFTVHEGWLGLSLFYCFYARYTDSEAFLEEAAKYLNNALAVVDPKLYKREYASDSYDYRMASLGLFFRKVNQHGFLHMDESILLPEIDQILFHLARIKMAESDYSRFSGALSSGHYFYHSNKNNPLRLNILNEIVLGLETAAQRDTEGDLYWTSAGLKNKIYLGCHGSAMVISFLSGLMLDGIAQEKCSNMLVKAVNFVLKQKRPEAQGMFPIIIGAPPGPTQFSQCFGDLGVGYALFRAAQALKNAAIKSAADDILNTCALRKYEDGHTPDAGITYGAAGVSNLFGKLARIDSDNSNIFSAAEQYWLSQIPRYATFNNEFTGFQSSLFNSPAHINVSFGWGLIGIGISLMKYLKPDLPDLDVFDIYI